MYHYRIYIIIHAFQVYDAAEVRSKNLHFIIQLIIIPHITVYIGTSCCSFRVPKARHTGIIHLGRLAERSGMPATIFALATCAFE